MNETKITPDVGCYVDGHWGQYGIARVIIIAKDYGWDDDDAIKIAEKHLASMGPSTNPSLDDDEWELLSDATQAAEDWLNDNVSDNNHSWGWNDGEFFYQSTEWWVEY